MSDFDVVFIDDDVTLTKIFQYYVLTNYKDWRFQTFSNSAIAYDQIVNQKISANVWIIDMMMSGKNGTQIAEAIRKNQNGDEPIVLAHTSMDQKGLINNAEYKSRLKHFSGVFNKGDGFSDLLSLVDNWVTQTQH